jgi:MarR family transcriptional regulator, organic hydroperoxide resistance regulator
LYRFTTSLPYLLNRAGVRMGEMFSRELEPYGITLPMYRVLAALTEKGGQRLSDLGEMTVIEVSTLSRLVASMQKMGLVVRQRVASNQREVEIRLTPSGNALADELMPQAAHFEDVGVEGFSAQEIEIFRRGLVAIHERLGLLEEDLTRARLDRSTQGQSQGQREAQSLPTEGLRRTKAAKS